MNQRPAARSAPFTNDDPPMLRERAVDARGQSHSRDKDPARTTDRRDFEDAYTRTGFQDEVSPPPRLHLEPGRARAHRHAPGRRGRGDRGAAGFDVRRLAAAVPAPEDAGAKAAVRVLRRDDVAGAAAELRLLRRDVADSDAERLLRDADARADAGTAEPDEALLPPGRVLTAGLAAQVADHI